MPGSKSLGFSVDTLIFNDDKQIADVFCCWRKYYKRRVIYVVLIMTSCNGAYFKDDRNFSAFFDPSPPLNAK